MSVVSASGSSTASDRRTDLILNESLNRRIFMLALPTLLQQLLTFCVGMFDTWLSGRIDAAATSAIGVAAYLGWLASMLVNTVGIGTTAMVARHCGSRQPDDANRVMHTALILGQIVSMTMVVVLYLMAPVFVRSFQMTGRTAEIAMNYLRVDALGHALTGVAIIGSCALRGAGDMKRPMLVLSSINVFNIVASLALVYGIGPEAGWSCPVQILPTMGVYGIATGTMSARLLGGLLMLFVLVKGSGPLKLRWSVLKFDGSIFRRLVRLGSFAGADSLIHWSGHFAFILIIRHVIVEGVPTDTVFAAHVVGIQVEAITYLPAIAWGQAAATVIGQCLGARKLRRAFHAGLVAVLQCGLLASGVGLAFYFGADAIYRAMHTDALVGEVGVPAFRVMALFQVPLIVFLVFRFSLQGAGDTRFPMVTTILGIGACRIPAAWLGGVVWGYGLVGAWSGMFIDLTFRATMMTTRYLRRKWLRMRV